MQMPSVLKQTSKGMGDLPCVINCLIGLVFFKGSTNVGSHSVLLQ